MSTQTEPPVSSQFDLEAVPGERGLGDAASEYWNKIKGGDLGALPAVFGADRAGDRVRRAWSRTRS